MGPHGVLRRGSALGHGDRQPRAARRARRVSQQAFEKRCRRDARRHTRRPHPVRRGRPVRRQGVDDADRRRSARRWTRRAPRSSATCGPSPGFLQCRARPPPFPARTDHHGRRRAGGGGRRDADRDRAGGAGGDARRRPTATCQVQPGRPADPRSASSLPQTRWTTRLAGRAAGSRPRATVPLGSVADIGFGAGPASIARVDRRRSATVEADLAGLTLGEARPKSRHCRR